MGGVLRGLLICCIASPLVGCGSLPVISRPMNLEESFIFHPRPFSKPDLESDDGAYEEARFQAPGGPRLYGWFAESAEPQAVVLYCHGNAGNIASRRWVLRLFQNHLNTSVLLFDYRGFGKSEGTPSETGVLADARAARKWLAERTGVAESEIVLVGNSLGGGVAVDLASRDGARGLVLESTFTSLPDVAACHTKILPFHKIMRYRMDSQRKIGNYHGPLLQTHGTADQLVPYPLGERLFENANEPKTFISVPGGGHTDKPSDEYISALKNFLNTLSAPDSAKVDHPHAETGKAKIQVP